MFIGLFPLFLSTYTYKLELGNQLWSVGFKLIVLTYKLTCTDQLNSLFAGRIKFSGQQKIDLGLMQETSAFTSVSSIKKEILQFLKELCLWWDLTPCPHE